MLRSIRWYVRFFCIAGVLCSATPLIAQIDRGTIEGLVKDPSGAVVPGAKVKIVQTATNSTYDLVKFTLGADLVNPFNIVRWGNPSTLVGLPTFGQITTTQGARQIQINMGLSF